MTAKQAESQGLGFTGIYSFDKEEVKSRIERERKERPGCRIVMVFKPANPLSRGGRSGGYAAYANGVYRAYDMLKDANRALNDYQSRMADVKAEYENNIAAEEIIRERASKTFDECVKMIEDATGKPLTNV
jgi:hypothetical protein